MAMFVARNKIRIFPSFYVPKGRMTGTAVRTGRPLFTSVVILANVETERRFAILGFGRTCLPFNRRSVSLIGETVWCDFISRAANTRTFEGQRMD